MDNLILTNIIFAVGLIVALTIHEFSHAFTADHFGDPTPRAYGRVSLNPLRHLDPVGTLMLLIFHFGWGKPVPIDPYNLSKKEQILVSLAGPGSNLILATVTAILIRLLPANQTISSIVVQFIYINLILAIFNLIPIPPLDGSKLFLNLLPESQSIEWEKALDRYGFIILIALLFLPINGSNIINLIISPIINFLLRLLLGYS
jgi:Zn-dependent protease